MHIRIQSHTPYQDCLRWQLQQDYFQQRGLMAFSSSEVPSYVTSNYHAARQLAQLLLSALEQPGETVRVLETAGGSGWFAWSFVRAFDDLCQAQQRSDASRLEYWLSDSSAACVSAWETHAYLAPLIAQGRLRILRADLDDPPEGPFDACFTHYGHCTLPAAILRKSETGFSELWVDLDYPQALAASPAGYRQEAIIQHDTFVPITLAERIPDPRARQTVEELLADHPSATLLYAPASWRAMEQTLKRLKPHGLLIITDKALVDSAEFAGERACPFTLHGNSLAHATPFPLLAAYARRLGGCARMTAALPDELQTLVIGRGERLAPAVEAAFETHFLSLNLNLLLCSLKSACQALYRQGDLAGAARHYAKLLAYDPLNAEGQYVLAQHLLAEGHFEWALRSLSTPHDDLLGVYAFALLRGMAHEGLQQPAAAWEAYARAIREQPDQLEAWCGGLRCLQQLGRREEARHLLQRARETFPEAPELEAWASLSSA